MKKKPLMLALALATQVGMQTSAQNAATKEVHKDRVFLQDYAVKNNASLSTAHQYSLAADRNGVVQVLEANQLLMPYGGYFQLDGKLVPDKTYLPMKDKKVLAIDRYQDQLVYLDDKAVFSNAWAGSVYFQHSLVAPTAFVGGKDFVFLAAAKNKLQLLQKDQAPHAFELPAGFTVLDIVFDAGENLFWILTEKEIYSFSPGGKTVNKALSAERMTALAFHPAKNQLVVGTKNGYFTYDVKAKKQSEINQKLPWTEITTVQSNGDDIWFGSSMGAFKMDAGGHFSYYHGKRWMPGEQVKDLIVQDNKTHVLTENGLGTIVFEEMTLEQKAAILDRQMRERHIRHGFNSSIDLLEPGNLGTARLTDSDNDGLWTTMYLAGEAFRYAVTKSPEALQNCKESLLAMERLFTINPVEGFPSRSFERRGYIEQLSDPERWQHASDPEWDWKATTSSDEAIGHVFVFGVLAEVVDDPWVKAKSIELLDALMTHIVKNDMYLIDYDGKPTLWGKWNPDYVNSFPTSVGDRKLNSSNITGMLQTAYYFTGKQMYKDKAFELMDKYGYLENMMRPMAGIGRSGEGSDDWSKMLSDGWNHSDDEMYYVGYWGLYRYAFDEKLKAKYKESIVDHWEAERPEKEGLWNIMTALVQPENFDLEEAIWFLERHPIDLISWNVKNSHRKDIELMEPNFRNQTTKEVLPPSEARIARHNANRFALDGGNDGRVEYSPGDIWLLPYWMGRYLEVIQ
ncbi:hypothetical protein J0A67_04195 [Algoriphagus aestuariicola]|uniref:Glycosyl hydrolase family 88 n=1 Tax=Algoriphagus aestuariicola TaxID=1852016 RepID=A0ABS3BM01_9BACT|nr:hypothetical protein [Algoriphagus aestuariicola]MBN7800047.1 hypothetical protein [Algoriphagus aestuariicola]